MNDIDWVAIFTNIFYVLFWISSITFIISVLWIIWAVFDVVPMGYSTPICLTSFVLGVVFGVVWEVLYQQ